MKRLIKCTAMVLAILLLLACGGCKQLLGGGGQGQTEEDQGPITMDLQTDDAGSGDGPTPPPTSADGRTASEQFHDLDTEMFRWYVTQDGYTFHMLVGNPSDYGINRSDVSMTLGEFTEESTQEYAAEAADYLERLYEIPRINLSEKEQLSYDITAQYLERVGEDAAFAYYYEPLTEYNGIHADIPLMFALLEIESGQDAEDYLALFADVPRYMNQILDYEKTRAEKGMFMTEDALDTILKDIQTIIDSKDDSFLYATFDTAIDGLGDISSEQKAAYKARNKSLLESDFIQAFQSLHDGLENLREQCRDTEGAYALGGQGADYFAFRLADSGDNALTVDETMELLQTELLYTYMKIAEIYETDPDVQKRSERLTSGNTDTDLALIKKITADILPELPEHALNIQEVPKELQSLMSPACYVVPAMDEWQTNEVMINPTASSDSLLFTLAHESYPGHLYQYVYQRGNDELGLMQRVLSMTGYTEGWSQMAEYLVSEEQTQYDDNYCKLVFYNDRLNTLLPAIISIRVNYYGYTEESIQAYLDQLMLSNTQQLAKRLYRVSIEQPYYYMPYAVGYSQLMSMMRNAETDLGDNFNRKDFLKTYLDLGPGFFNLISERMDVWLDNYLLDA